MSDTPDRTESVFAGAVVSSPAERAAFLDQACAGDPALRERVEVLLRAHERAGHLLDRPAPGAPNYTAAYVPDELPGAVIAARYKLLEAIGEGGMGTVWVAEQIQPVRRKVALKLIKAGMDSKRVLARFEAERQALAMMDHPNVAKVLDGGLTEAGRPFFVMEYVKGVPITEFCDAARLSVPERLQLFTQVCQAVQHAHQKGIIHRDLKPSNILVAPYDDKPVPKIIDFGLAKAMHQSLTEKTLYTAHDSVLGTPLYMSPEQAQLNNLDVDTRSDIYSLGVVLYELLTGTTPLEKKRFNEAAWDEIRRLIREEEPPRPSTRLSSDHSLPSLAVCRHTEPFKLTKQVRGDLDWIVMKALEKDRTRRYETANGLAGDLHRYLADEMVEARPPSAGYRLRKFARRNKGRVVAASLVLLALVTGMVGTTFGLIRAERARRAEVVQREVAEVELRKAEEERAKAVAERDAKERALGAETKARTQTLEALVAMTDDVIERLFARQPTLGEDERAFLRKVMGFYAAFAAERGDSAYARYAAAVGRFRIAKLQSFLGERSEAAAGFREAIGLWKKLADDFPAPAVFRMELARSLGFLGSLLSENLGNREEAEAVYRQALAIQEKLAAEFPVEVAHFRADLGSTHVGLGHVLAYREKNSEAELHFRQAMTIQEALAAEFPTLSRHRSDLAAMHNNLGELLNKVGKKPEAETEFRLALPVRRKLATDFPAVPDYRRALARTLNNLGLMLNDDAMITEALSVRETLAADFPASHDYRLELAGSYVNYGNLLQRRQQPQDSLAWYAKAIPLMEVLAAREPHLALNRTYLRNAYSSRADALVRLQRHADAAKDWGRAMELEEGPKRQQFQLSRANSLARAGDHTNAAAEAEAWSANTVSADGLYNSACILSLCSAACKGDADLQKNYADRAMALLTRSIAAGFTDVSHMKADDDLAALRPREEFKIAVSNLEKSPVPNLQK